MRIVIDLQGAQSSGSRFRGIGRYSLSLAQAMAREARDHEIWIALNGLFPDSIQALRVAFDGLVPQDRIVVWQAPGPVADIDSGNRWRREAGECLREAFLARLKPDVVHVSSLFEGLSDDALTAIGAFDGEFATAVTLYDLIPLIHRDPYLANPVVASWYERKLESLRRARLWLSISESSRREGIELLNLPEDRVVNISTAADAMFQPVHLSAEHEGAIRRRYGLTKPFVMYTGGIDHRKNIDGLIRAFAKLPVAVRAAHQLVLVCAATGAQIDELMRMAAQCGLAGDDVACTGFIPNSDMVALYNLCTVFAFPSWHEGFGLPALEAMSCGAAVIAANTSSLPEVIGRPDALFDPHDENDMAAKLYAVLTDDDFRAQLQRHGLDQSRTFSWDNTARRALEAFERLDGNNQAMQASPSAMLAPRRPRLAFVSPLPPEKSGIADYSAELLPELARHYDIDVIVHQSEVADAWILANCPVRSAEWFDQNARRYDRVLYQFGNSAFHQHMFGLLSRHPGTVVLHDFFLSGVIAYMDAHGQVPGAWAAALYASHGYHAVKQRFAAHDATDVLWNYPANLPVLQQANGVIVHSEFSRELAYKWYGASFSANWECIPHLRVPSAASDPVAARVAVGMEDGDFLVCAFGMIGPTKLNHRLLEAWLASPLAQDPRCHLVFVGENDGGAYGAELLRAIDQSGAAGRIRITGFAPKSLYRRYLEAADAAVQMRTLSRGETSGTVLDCLNHGLPTIVNAHGAMVELPPDCILEVPDEFSEAELSAALVALWRDPPRRKALGEHARAQVRTYHHPQTVANQYRDAIERFARVGPQVTVPRLAQAVSALESPPANEREWLAVAQSIAVNHPPQTGEKQLLLEVSALAQLGARSGKQRLVHKVLDQLLSNPPTGFRIEPIYVGDLGDLRYARNFTLQLLGCPEARLPDDPVEVNAGDVFLGLDRAAFSIPQRAGQLGDWRNQGVQVYFAVHEAPTVTTAHGLAQGTAREFAAWLESTGANADGAVCVSRAVADELAECLRDLEPLRERPFNIGWLHPGADVTGNLLDIILRGRAPTAT